MPSNKSSQNFAEPVEEIVEEPAHSEPVEPVLEETKAIPWTPRLIATDGKDDTASITKGRLLGRAFGNRPSKTADE